MPFNGRLRCQLSMNTPSAAIEISTPYKRYKPAGCCIYCGRQATKLSLEHIIPFGLAGDSLQFPSASCKRCREKTCEFENACMGQLWWPFRTKIGAPSRKKRQSSSFLSRTLNVDDAGDGGLRERDVLDVSLPLDDFPLIYVACKYWPPGLLEGRPAQEELMWVGWSACDDDHLKSLTDEQRNAIRLTNKPFHARHLSRLLAKIAHGYATAELGLRAFRPYLPDYIRGTSWEFESQCIGGEQDVPPATEALHEIACGVVSVDGKNLVVVTLRLFAFIGAPLYRIVVGELECTLDQLPFVQQPTYTIDIKPPLPRVNLTPRVVTIGR